MEKQKNRFNISNLNCIRFDIRGWTSYKHKIIKPLKIAYFDLRKGVRKMKEKIVLNYKLFDFITLTIKDLIESTIEDEPEKIFTFISINNMLNGIENLSTNTIINYVSELLIDKIFEEIKNSI